WRSRKAEAELARQVVAPAQDGAVIAEHADELVAAGERHRLPDAARSGLTEVHERDGVTRLADGAARVRAEAELAVVVAAPALECARLGPDAVENGAEAVVVDGRDRLDGEGRPVPAAEIDGREIVPHGPRRVAAADVVAVAKRSLIRVAPALDPSGVEQRAGRTVATGHRDRALSRTEVDGGQAVAHRRHAVAAVDRVLRAELPLHVEAPALEVAPVENGACVVRAGEDAGGAAAGPEIDAVAVQRIERARSSELPEPVVAPAPDRALRED